MDGDGSWWYGGGGGGDNNWDLYAVVRFGCGGGGRVVTQPPPSPPPPPAETLPGGGYDPLASSSPFAVPPTTTWAAPPVLGDELWDAAWMAPLPALHSSGGCGEIFGIDELCAGAFFAASEAPTPSLLPLPQEQQQQVQEQQPPAVPVPVPVGQVMPPPQLQEATDAPPAVNPLPVTNQKEASAGNGDGGSKPKRNKKKQTKKTVVRVLVDGPPADSWAWRKYGQKPIKGSPHPRGYYRCSSNKNCGARKQVERCRIDPSYLILTYTGKHSGHEVPLHRNSLSGTTRHKQLQPSLSYSYSKPPCAAPASAGKRKRQAPAAGAHATTISFSQSPGQSTSPRSGMSPTTPLHPSSIELHDEDQLDCGGDGDGLQQHKAEDMDDDDDDVDEIFPVPWGTPVPDAFAAATSEWK
ncbi:hypothetical protein GUJ93_ZPchr0006g42602 [Zizania palustris]|uniref:WRKY domain-containing protein n=1 Tax=Zizania palustris TaxID=103762 RepID=A0A8J5T1T0_ZIZPA|nr:hypothetical protein GUJ93_ZPchr0006g42602 [Zizania palustris]